MAHADGLSATGLVLCNAPYTLNDEWSGTLSWLAQALAQGVAATSAVLCDRVGHIMNYGDGWYGGVYIAAMYSLAFISPDVGSIVENALKVLPPSSSFARPRLWLARVKC